MYTRYLDSITKERSSEYWSDLGIIEAMNLLDNFDGRDWRKLRQEISKFSSEIKIRCAETLIIYSKDAFEILKELTLNSNASVVIAAIDSLSSMTMDKDVLLLNVRDLSAILNNVKSSFQFSGLERMVFDSFEFKLNELVG